MSLNKIKLFIDMDGVVCVFKYAPLEQITSKGYFLSLEPMEKMIAAVKELSVEYDTYILSSVFNDDHSVIEKQSWIMQYIPELQNKAFFVPYGESKSDYIEKMFGEKVDCNAFLIDDFTRNLRQWKGTGIKLYNGINGTKKTWDGYSVNYQSTANVIAKTIKGIIYAVSTNEKLA